MARRPPRTHCRRGHPYDDANIYRPPGDVRRRYCRACMKLHSMSGAQKRKRRAARGLPTTTTRPTWQSPSAARRRAAQLAWLHEYKLAHGCADCGYREHPVALEFDHLPGSQKLGGLSRMIGCSEARLLAEIAKCEVVCANCHAIRTYNRNQAKRIALSTSPHESDLSTCRLSA
jgi:hypothetical protein